MDEIDVQMTETVLNETSSSDLMGKLILEELRCFRREMKEEVQKLNKNLQTFIFSKADIVNEILGNSSLLNESKFNLDIIDEEKSKTSDRCLFKGNNSSTSTADFLNMLNKQPLTSFENIAPDVETFPGSHTVLIDGNSDLDECSSDEYADMTSEVDSKLHRPMSLSYVSNHNDRKSAQTSAEVFENGIKRRRPNTSKFAIYSRNTKSAMVKKTNQFQTTSGSMPLSAAQSSISTGKLQLSLPPFSKKRKVIKTLHYSKSRNPNERRPLLLDHHAIPKMPSNFTQRITLKKNKNTGKFEEQPGLVDVKYISRMKNRCEYCDKTFLSNNDLKRHIRIHTGDRPFQCTICTKAYTRNDHLKRHMKQKHVLSDQT